MIENSIYFEGDEEFFSQSISQPFTHRILVAEARTNGFCVPLVRTLIPELKKADLIVLPAGEENKTLDTCSLLWSELVRRHIDKHTILVAVGGGMLSDTLGLAASLYKRGIAFASIPTTLLAMVDAAHGGKTAIDFEGIKNTIGSYHTPVSTYVNPIFLHTLPERVVNSGIAEMIKHALLDETNTWNEVKKYTLDQFKQLTSIKKSISIKNNFVSKDPYDQGIRQALNFGHTLGHAIESASLHTSNPLLHGEAIMLGMELELQLSCSLLGFEAHIFQEYKRLREALFPFLTFEFNPDTLLHYLKHDKKNDNQTRMSLLQSIGNPAIQCAVSNSEILNVFSQYDIA